MFGKKKDNGAALGATAKKLITEAIDDIETKGDLAYAIGLINMAYGLEIITINERANFMELAHKKELKR